MPEAEGAGSARAAPRFWPKAARRVLIAVAALGFGALALQLGARALYYASTSLPDAVALAVATSLRDQMHALQILKLLPPVDAVIAALGTALLVVRPGLLIESRLAADGNPRHGLRPWVWAVLGALTAVHPVVFDADPLLARLCWATLALLAAGLWLRGVGPGGRIRGFVGTTLLGSTALLPLALAPRAPSPACLVALLVWALVLGAAALAGTRRLRRLDTVGLVLVAMPLATFVLPIGAARWLPEPLRRGARVLEESGYTYDFCEHPARHQLFATVPLCSADDPEACRDGYVVEYETRELERVAEHRFFDDQFFGGLRELLCLGDEVQVTLNHVRLGGRTHLANVMSFDPEDPTRFRSSIFSETVQGEETPDLLGHRGAWDRERDSVWYVSEWTNKVFRLDRASGGLDRGAGRAFPYQRLDRAETWGLFTGPESLARERGSIFFSEWGDGSRVWELGLADQQLRSVRDTFGTGSFGVAVDEELGRALVSNMWGLVVLDLDSGRVLERLRLAPGVRVAQIDHHNDLVYVATTFGGYVFVLDRHDLRTLARITTGLGGRRPHLTADGRHLFASSQSSTFVVETAAIVTRARR